MRELRKAGNGIPAVVGLKLAGTARPARRRGRARARWRCSSRATVSIRARSSSSSRSCHPPCPRCRAIMGIWPLWTACTGICGSSARRCSTRCGSPAAPPRPRCWRRWRSCGNSTRPDARKVPSNAPTGFVPARWRGYLDTAEKAGNVTAYRHYWELCTLLALRDGLRTEVRGPTRPRLRPGSHRSRACTSVTRRKRSAPSAAPPSPRCRHWSPWPS